MLIESIIKPQPPLKTRTVDIFGQRYEFEEVQKGRYVASVTDQDAIDCLLGNKAFSEYTDKLTAASAPSLASASAPAAPAAAPAAPAPAKPTPTPTKPAPAPPTPPDTKVDASATASETEILAQALLSSTPIAIKKQLEKNMPSGDVLRAAIKLEKAAKSPRQHVLSGLTGALSSLEA